MGPRTAALEAAALACSDCRIRASTLGYYNVWLAYSVCTERLASHACGQDMVPVSSEATCAAPSCFVLETESYRAPAHTSYSIAHYSATKHLVSDKLQPAPSWREHLTRYESHRAVKLQPASSWREHLDHYESTWLVTRFSPHHIGESTWINMRATESPSSSPHHLWDIDQDCITDHFGILITILILIATLGTIMRPNWDAIDTPQSLG